MAKVAYYQLTKGSGSKVMVTGFDTADTPVFAEERTFGKQSDFEKVAKALGVAPSAVIEAVIRFRSDPSANTKHPGAVPTDDLAKPFTVEMRGIRQLDEDAVKLEGATPAEALRKALGVSTFPAVEPLLIWKREGKGRLASLDVDFVAPPNRPKRLDHDIEEAFHTIEPRPIVRWRTHGGWLRFIFESRDGFAAESLAAVAAFGLSIRCRAWGFVKEASIHAETRHPGFPRTRQGVVEHAGPVLWAPSNADIGILSKDLSVYDSVDEDAVEAWLSRRGFERGRRYPHSACLIAPSEHGGRDPVWIGDHGVFCYVCDSTRGRGFLPWARILGTGRPSLLRKVVAGRVHWAHARLQLVAPFGLKESTIESAYRALLASFHGVDDPRIDDVFRLGDNFIRSRGLGWVTRRGEPYGVNVKYTVRELPAVRSDRDEIIPTMLDEFHGIHDLSEHGYFGVRLIEGFDFSSFLEQSAGDLPCRVALGVNPKPAMVIYPPALRCITAEYARPNIDNVGDLDEESAWRIFEGVLPGLNRNLVKCLLVARAFAQRGGGMPPIVFLSGQSGSGKTSTTNFAAAVSGACVHQTKFDPDSPERMHQALLKASDGFCFYDEINKSIQRARMKGIGAFDQLLSLSPNSQGHILYVGQVRLEQLPPVILADTEPDADFLRDPQIGRRVVLAHLESRVEWEKPLAMHGIYSIDEIRLGGSHRDLKFAHAANRILRSVCELLQQNAGRKFSDVAANLGFNLIEKGRPLAEAHEDLRRFFVAVCEEPSPDESIGATYLKAIRKAGDGMKFIGLNRETALSAFWKDSIADNPSSCESRKASSVAWNHVLGVSFPVKFERGRVQSGRYLAVRFTAVVEGETLVNEQIMERVGRTLTDLTGEASPPEIVPAIEPFNTNALDKILGAPNSTAA